MKLLMRTAVLCVATLPLTGCLDSMVKPEASVDRGVELQLPPYDGPRAKAAVTNFEWSVGESKTTIGVAGADFSVSHSEYAGISSGLQDMLTTSLVQSKRYRVLERQRLDSVKDEIALSEEGYTDDSGKQRGNIKGADIAVIASITGWDPATKGTGGSVGGLLGGSAGALLGGISGAFKESSMAMDIRIVDVATSEVLAATRVEGVAKDANVGAALGALTGSAGLGGSLGTFARTPMEKAIRTCIYEATKYIVENTPQEYMIH
ncbi:MAG: CsgG/HfaB family protein [Gammaproteobacteria bacterium]|nr:CsgG/HfaB family protein [Gammaproteobacteria bacterium]